jgi:transcriptional regulator with XRE-family HTH domain
LREKVRQLGKQSLLADQIGISRSYLHDILHRRRRPGLKVLRYLGLKPAALRYEPKG